MSRKKDPRPRKKETSTSMFKKVTEKVPPKKKKKVCDLDACNKKLKLTNLVAGACRCGRSNARMAFISLNMMLLVADISCSAGPSAACTSRRRSTAAPSTTRRRGGGGSPPRTLWSRGRRSRKFEVTVKLISY